MTLSLRILRAAPAIAAVASALLLASCSGEPSTAKQETLAVSGDYPYYATVDDLAKASPLIVTVRVTTSRADTLAPKYEGDDPLSNPLAGVENPDPKTIEDGAVPITVHDAQVESVIAGTAKPGETISIQQLGGELNGTNYVDEDDKPLAQGKTYLLFLEPFDDAPAGIVGGLTGQFIPTDDQAQSFVSVDTSNPLKISQAELARLAQK